MNGGRLTAIAALALWAVTAAAGEWRLPVNAADRRSWRDVRLTNIGRFGLRRRARPGVPSHLHTGIDIRRPSRNYATEPVYPAATGCVISVRDDGPFAQVIIEHLLPGSSLVWTVYEHIAGIRAATGDTVTTSAPIGRFMTAAELDRYGWQFDHVHFEVLRQRPRKAQPSNALQMRFYQAYALECTDSVTLLRYYHDPVTFLETLGHFQ